MLECVLFDLDNTLLVMDQDRFTAAYFESISGYLAINGGYEPKRLVDTILAGTKSMLLPKKTASGRTTNYERFWSVFADEYGEGAAADKRIFDKYYERRFDELAGLVKPVPYAAETIKKARALGLKTVLASNPVFPKIAMTKRAGWAGIDSADFDLVTSYENSHYCKPDPAYYKEIADGLGVPSEHCLMVGNDVSDDMSAQKCGMHVLLLPEYILNLKNADISPYPQSSMKDAAEYIERNLL